QCRVKYVSSMALNAVMLVCDVLLCVAGAGPGLAGLCLKAGCWGLHSPQRWHRALNREYR
ncbi:hypothetical protein CDAR_495921, partial [Caerostris darwini]